MEVTLFGRTIPVGWPQIVLGGIVLIGAMAIVTAGVTATTPFAVYNADWTGTSDLRQLADGGDRTVIVAPNGSHPTTAYTNETVMLVVGTPPNTTATQQTAQRVIAQGGTVVVADDIGTHSNDLLSAIGASARIQTGPLRDPRSYDQGPTLPIAEPTSSGQSRNISEFTLNHAGVVTPNGAIVLAQTSEFAYIDQNQNDQFDQRESLGRRPVLTTEDVGDGQVIVLSDSSVFVNAMLDQDGNTALARALIDDADTVILSSATPQPLPPLANALLAARYSPLLQALLLTALVGGMLVLTRGVSRNHDPRPEDTPTVSTETPTAPSPAGGDEADATEGFIQLLTDKYPEWDREQLRRVVQATVTDGVMNNDEITGKDTEDE